MNMTVNGENRDMNSQELKVGVQKVWLVTNSPKLGLLMVTILYQLLLKLLK